MTGEGIDLLPEPDVEARQTSSSRCWRELFPAPPRTAVAPSSARAADTDAEVLERAFAAKNGADVQALYRGDVGGYGSRSEADLALCSMLAFWTGPDPEQLDRLFRGSRADARRSGSATTTAHRRSPRRSRDPPSSTTGTDSGVRAPSRGGNR